jgi:NADP-dependent 3-hydroxy acid dehydrogenase YdfG
MSSLLPSSSPSPPQRRAHPSTAATPVALVTGASSGIGAAIVERLVREGWTVYAAARRADRLQALSRTGARPLVLDLTDGAAVERVIGGVLAADGRIDALINNAGYGAYGALEDISLSEGRRQFDVNVFALAHVTQQVLPTMRRQRRGRIVNISSIGGRIHEPMGSWYHATKFAVEGLSDCLRMELAPFGIDVVVVQPGAVSTEWSGIARASLLATSGHTAYAAQARRSAALLAGADASSGAAPSAVADAVWDALRRRRPRTRYAVGGGARPLLALRRWLPDRAFDRLMDAAAGWMLRRTGARGASAHVAD